MLKVLTGAVNDSSRTALLTEGETGYNGKVLTKETIEHCAELPEGYTAGTKTVSQDGNFWYKVVEV